MIELTAEALAQLRGKQPKIVVCGLNPHAGEHGLFGDREEERIIIPAIEAARAKGIDIEGPLPPDTAFLPWKRKATDAFVCMYHDQGHIPVKALAFDSAVNTTLGLPIIRTSVDHGTACDIAWQGKANPSSIFCRRAAGPAADCKLTPTPMAIVIIADDLSGAAELAGIAFAHGLRRKCSGNLDPVTARGSHRGRYGLAAVDLAGRRGPSRGTRTGPSSPAGRLGSSRRLTPFFAGISAAEIAAILSAAGMSRAVLVPANPSRGRTIAGGSLCHWWRAADQTAFVRTIRSSRAARHASAALLGRGAGHRPPDVAESGQPAVARPRALMGTASRRRCRLFPALLDERRGASCSAKCGRWRCPCNCNRPCCSCVAAAARGRGGEAACSGEGTTAITI